MRVYKFRNCLLNTAERSVIKENQHLDLTTKTFDVLEYLIENAGKVVSKDEILGHVWNGNFVEESNLPVHISKLRRSLSETRDYRFIETVQGTGYRFVAPLETVGHAEWQAALTALRDFPFVESKSRTDTLQSIAVLPLRNESGDPDLEYLADGLTEGLINALSHIPEVKVIARNTVFRFKNADVDACRLGENLGVRVMLTGRVRVVDEIIFVGVELIRGLDGTQIWGDSYKRQFSEILSLQDDILFSIREKLGLANPAKKRLLANPLTSNAESYRLYLRGKYLLEKRSSGDMYKAIDFFTKSVSLDVQNIHSYTEIVEGYRLLYVFDYISYSEFCSKSKPVVDLLNRWDGTSDAVQVMYCDLKMLDWKFCEAAQYCRQALVTNPNCLKGRLRYSELLLQSRNFTAALEQLETIMTLDPLSAVTYIHIARLFYLTGRYDDAIAYLDDALELEPGSYEVLALKGAVYMELGNYEAAMRDFQHSLHEYHHPEILAMTAVVYAKRGQGAQALKILRKLESDSKGSSGHSSRLAYIYLALGQKNEAYACLDAAYSMHEPDLRALTYDHRWLPLRSEPRFVRRVRRVGLPAL
jgi:TolB-like protein/Flp pilus assembly protein TadD